MDISLQDGVGISDFAFVFLEFAMMPKMPKNADTCRKAQDVVKHLLSSTVQNQLSTLGFFPIPLDVRSAIRLVMHFMLKSSCTSSFTCS